jgi:hypothetical protein
MIGLNKSSVDKAQGLFKESDALLTPINDLIQKVAAQVSKMLGLKTEIVSEIESLENVLQGIEDREAQLLAYKEKLEGMLS